ncbi:hypothetical protein OKA04_09830 [Luteolibacter flavescens]|uniref:Uncharacterized protein n=1 Tax=Luteolibacter flavescens TaxID=1859460 RepID=A0ABT3FN78_9BACT|nr:hypothetical protein [Luteolibacter flavescens]MCW1885026.1 hypothetical protein [Luteolibacter flavescens]
MNAMRESPRHCTRPADCEPGDWVEAGDVPDWTPEEETHAYVLPGQVMVQPVHQMPVTVPLVSWNFHRDRVSDDAGTEVMVWVRQA